MSRRSATHFPFRQDLYSAPLEQPRIQVPESALSAADGEHPGQPIRPPASAEFVMDSLDRYTDPFQRLTGTIPANDFLLSRQQALLYGYFTRLAITQILLEYRVPTITPRNNTLVLTTSPAQNIYTVTLDTGYYNETTLAAEIQTKVLALPGNPFAGFTATAGNAFGGITLACAGVQFLVDAQYDNIVDHIYNASRTAITVGATNENLTIAGNTQVLQAPQLSYTRYIDLVSDRLTKFQRVKDGTTKSPKNQTAIVARMYLTAPNSSDPITATTGVGSLPFNLCIDYNTPKHIKWSPNEALNELDFRLYDEFGDLLYWDADVAPTEFQLTILASET